MIVYQDINIPVEGRTPRSAAFRPFATQSEWTNPIPFYGGPISCLGKYSWSQFMVSDPAQCASVVSGNGWTFKYSTDNGASWSPELTYNALRNLTWPFSAKPGYAQVKMRCVSDGISSRYPLAWLSLGAYVPA
jgi:hypothetical protein